MNHRAFTATLSLALFAAMAMGQAMPQSHGGGGVRQGSDPTFLLFCCALIPALVLFALWLWALIDCLQRDFKGNDKIVWILVILLLNGLGAIIYLLIGRQQGWRRAGEQGPPPSA